MIKNTIYPWVYSYTTFHDRTAILVEEGSDELTIEAKLPGVNKEDIEIDYYGDKRKIHIFVKDKLDKDIWLSSAIDDKKVEATLDLGVLKIVAPLLNSSKRIQIK